MEAQQSFLSIKVIWKDESFMELRFSVISGYFHGSTSVYESPDGIYKLAADLDGFPDASPVILYKAGKKNEDSYCALKFYQADPRGLIALRIYMEAGSSAEINGAEGSRLSLVMLAEPNAIDIFQQRLIALAKQMEGEARLEGRDWLFF